MLAFLRMLEDRYGGVEQYLKNVVGLTDDDIATIRRNFLVPAPQTASSTQCEANGLS